MHPRDAFPFIFLLFLFQDELDKELLELFIAIVYAELFKTETKF